MTSIIICVMLQSAISSVTAVVSSSDKLILQNFYNAASGDMWIWNHPFASWNFSDPESDPCLDRWEGIRCERLSAIVDIYLNNNNMIGTLSEDLGNLKSLSYIQIVDNLNLYGPIPDTYGSLLNLLQMRFIFTSLDTTIPTTFCNLHSLTQLQISFNSLTGTIPSCIGKLTDLEDINLSFGSLSGSIPNQLFLISTIRTLTLTVNRFTSTIPSFHALTNIEYADISMNPFLQISNFPDGLCNNCGTSSGTSALTRPHSSTMNCNSTLRVIDFAVTNLKGPLLPSTLQCLVNIQELVLSSNYLSGTIPSDLKQLTSLQRLYLEDNLFTGTIPHVVHSLTNLNVLNIAGNKITGTLSNEISKLFQLKYLYLFDNFLTSSLPPTMEALSKLVFLYIGGNLLTSTIPRIFANTTFISELSLADNIFSGPMPLDIEYASQLSFINVSFNFFSSSLPAEFFHHSFLQFLYLSDNYFTSTVPSFGLNSSLEAIDVSNNLIGGTVPESIHTLQGFRYGFITNGFSVLQLNNNLMYGTIPCSIFTLSALETVTLGDNKFSGNIHHLLVGACEVEDGSDGSASSTTESRSNRRTASSLWKNTSCEKLKTLDLQNNLLTGTIPSEIFSRCSSMVSVILSRNCFAGSIPESLCSANLRNVIMNGLSSNSDYCKSKSALLSSTLWDLKTYITGSVPNCIGKMGSLQAVQLSGNGLTGSLPDGIFKLANLTHVYFDHNSFSGSIPWGDLVYQSKAEEGDREASRNIRSTNLDVLDLSVNSLGGKYTPLSSEETISMRSELKLFNNRLSGFSPNTKYTPVVEVLSGNIFDCDHSHPKPENDPDDKNYVCGSDQLVIGFSFYAVVSSFILLLTGIALGLFYFHQWLLLTVTAVEERVKCGTLYHITLRLKYIFNMCILYATEFSHWCYIWIQLDRKIRLDAMSFDSVANSSNETHIVNPICVDMPVSMQRSISIYEYYRNLCCSSTILNCKGSASGSDINCTLHKSLHFFFVGIFLQLLENILKKSLLLCCLLLTLCLSSYTFLKSDGASYSTYEDQYLWYYSIAFLKGVAPAVVISFVLGAFILLFVYMTQNEYYGLKHLSSAYWIAIRKSDADMSTSNNEAKSGNADVDEKDLGARGIKSDGGALEEKASSVVHTSRFASNQNSKSEPRKIDWRFSRLSSYKRAAVRYGIILFNCVAVFSVNAWYVIVITQNPSIRVQRVAQILMALFRLSWANVMVPLILKTMSRYSAYTSSQKVQIRTIITMVDTILIPCLANGVTSASCFYYQIFGSPSITSTYTINICKRVAQFTRNCQYSVDSTVYSTFTPSFVYNYQCSSAILTSYVPILLYTYSFTTLFSPIMYLVLSTTKYTQADVEFATTKTLQCHSTSFTYAYYACKLTFYKFLPKIFFLLMVLGEGFDSSDKDTSSTSMFQLEVILVNCYTTFVVLFTFGLACPLLGIVITVSIVVKVFLWRLVLMRYITVSLDHMAHGPLSSLVHNSQPFATDPDSSIAAINISNICQSNLTLLEIGHRNTYRGLKSCLNSVVFTVLGFGCIFVVDIVGDAKGSRAALLCVAIYSLFGLSLWIRSRKELKFIRTISKSMYTALLGRFRHAPPVEREMVGVRASRASRILSWV